MLTVRYINTNETYYFLRNKESGLSTLIAIDSIIDILDDSISILSTSNNLTVFVYREWICFGKQV